MGEAAGSLGAGGADYGGRIDAGAVCRLRADGERVSQASSDGIGADSASRDLRGAIVESALSCRIRPSVKSRETAYSRDPTIDAV